MKSRIIIGFLLMLSAGLLWDLTKLHVTSYIIGSIGFMFLSFGFMKINL
jgi:hypothetical protein